MSTPATLAEAPDGSVCVVDHRGDHLTVWVTGKHPKLVYARVRHDNGWTGPLTLDPATKVVRVVAQSLRLVEEEPLKRAP